MKPGICRFQGFNRRFYIGRKFHCGAVLLLGYGEGDRLLSVVAGHAAHLFFRRVHIRDIFQIDDLSALGRDRHLLQVIERVCLCGSRYGEGKITVLRVTGRVREVRCRHGTRDLVHRHLVLLHLYRIELHLHVLGGTAHGFHLSHRGELLEHRRDVLVDVIVEVFLRVVGDGEHDVVSAVHVHLHDARRTVIRESPHAV